MNKIKELTNLLLENKKSIIVGIVIGVVLANLAF